MARKTFFSFHYATDSWRVSQVRQIGAIEGNAAVSDDDWESVTKGGDAAIQRWIAGQLKGRTCTIVLLGEDTAGRKWITYEIKESWKARMGVVGIRIHNLKNQDKVTSKPDGNPFHSLMVGGKRLSSIVKLYNPAGVTSTDAYNSIASGIEGWVDEAINIRGKY
jgi:hypothetical protein